MLVLVKAKKAQSEPAKTGTVTIPQVLVTPSPSPKRSENEQEHLVSTVPACMGCSIAFFAFFIEILTRKLKWQRLTWRNIWQNTTAMSCYVKLQDDNTAHSCAFAFSLSVIK